MSKNEVMFNGIETFPNSGKSFLIKRVSDPDLGSLVEVRQEILFGFHPNNDDTMAFITKNLHVNAIDKRCEYNRYNVYNVSLLEEDGTVSVKVKLEEDEEKKALAINVYKKAMASRESGEK